MSLTDSHNENHPKIPPHTRAVPRGRRQLRAIVAGIFAHRFMKVRKLFAVALLSAASWGLCCSASDIYVAQTAQGADTGSDVANTHSVDWLSAAANWGTGASQVGAGTTVHLCGTFTNTVTLQGSGTLISPITVFFESGSKFSVPTWSPANPIISLGSQSGIVIDGGNDGTIEATDNGAGLTYSNSITGISLTGGSRVVIKNLTIQNLYVLPYPGAGLSSSNTFASGNGIIVTGDGVGNITVSNCILHDMYCGFGGAYGIGCSNYTMTRCTAYHCNWGGAFGDASSNAFLNGMTVDHCHFYNWMNWDNYLDNRHHNGFFTWAMQGGCATNITYCDNYVGPGFGVQNTSGLFIQGNVFSLLAYNNVFDGSDGTSPADGLIYTDLKAIKCLSTVQVFNNTFIGYGVPLNCTGDQYGTNTSVYTFINNECFLTTNSWAFVLHYGSNSVLVADTNNYVHSTKRYGAFVFSTTSGGGGQTLAQWRSAGYDLHSLTNDPNLDGNYQPQTNSILIGAGANLTVLGVTNDYAGNARPATGNWTIGAYEYGSAGGGSTTIPAAWNWLPPK